MDLVKLLAWLVTIVIMMSPDDDDNNKKAVESEKENRANSVFQFLIMKFQAPNWIGSLPKMKAQRHTERSDRHRHIDVNCTWPLHLLLRFLGLQSAESSV